MTPSCKWTYPQEFEGGVHVVQGDSGAELVANLLTFRIKQKIAIGDPEREVAAYIKAQSPNNDRFKGSNHRTRAERKPVPESAPLIERIRRNLYDLTDAKPAIVSEDEADRRAAICRECRQNVDWRIKSCGPCNEQVDYLALVLRQRTGYKHDAELKACRVHNLHLASAVFVDRDALPKEPNPNAPAECWVGAIPTV